MDQREARTLPPAAAFLLLALSAALLFYRLAAVPLTGPDEPRYARVAVEMASKMGWDRYVGPNGATIGMTTFGASAPLKDLLSKFGFTAAHVVEAAKAQLRARPT